MRPASGNHIKNMIDAYIDKANGMNVREATTNPMIWPGTNAITLVIARILLRILLVSTDMHLCLLIIDGCGRRLRARSARLACMFTRLSHRVAHRLASCLVPV
jgi:hypothetical protein